MDIDRMLSEIISKLAAINQPLSMRPDYGTTGDVAERLKKLQEKIKEAAMLKLIPMQDMGESEAPTVPQGQMIQDYDEDPVQIIVLDDYNQDQPEVVKQGPPCCSECGQEIPAVMGRSAGDISKRFKKLREMLNGNQLTAAQLKEVRRALDDIYHRYDEQERQRGYQWGDKNLNQPVWNS